MSRFFLQMRNVTARRPAWPELCSSQNPLVPWPGSLAPLPSPGLPPQAPGAPSTAPPLPSPRQNRSVSKEMKGRRARGVKGPPSWQVKRPRCVCVGGLSRVPRLLPLLWRPPARPWLLGAAAAAASRPPMTSVPISHCCSWCLGLMLTFLSLPLFCSLICMSALLCLDPPPASGGWASCVSEHLPFS